MEDLVQGPWEIVTQPWDDPIQMLLWPTPTLPLPISTRLTLA